MEFGVVKRRPFQIKDNPRGRHFTTPNSSKKCVLGEKVPKQLQIICSRAPLGVQLDN
jgi:hypothetical protein